MGKRFKIERIGDMFRLLWSWDAAGTCHHRSLTNDMKRQVALSAYELDVFSIAGLGPPNQKAGGLRGSAPHPKFEKSSKIFKKKIEES